MTSSRYPTHHCTVCGESLEWGLQAIVINPAKAVVDAWLKCTSCSATAWSPSMQDVLEILNSNLRVNAAIERLMVPRGIDDNALDIEAPAT